MGAFTYPRNEPGSSGHQDLVERLNAQIALLRHAVDGLRDDVLSRKSAHGWSAKDVIGHLCDVSHVLHRRLNMMILLEEPRLPPYGGDEMARLRDANAARAEDLLSEYASQRSETVDMLADLVHWNWARPGRHPTLGRISIRQQVELWLDHEDEHFAQIRSLTLPAAVT